MRRIAVQTREDCGVDIKGCIRPIGIGFAYVARGAAPIEDQGVIAVAGIEAVLSLGAEVDGEGVIAIP